MRGGDSSDVTLDRCMTDGGEGSLLQAISTMDRSGMPGYEDETQFRECFTAGCTHPSDVGRLPSKDQFMREAMAIWCCQHSPCASRDLATMAIEGFSGPPDCCNVSPYGAGELVDGYISWLAAALPYVVPPE